MIEQTTVTGESSLDKNAGGGIHANKIGLPSQDIDKPILDEVSDKNIISKLAIDSSEFDIIQLNLLAIRRMQCKQRTILTPIRERFGCFWVCHLLCKMGKRTRTKTA